MQLMAHSFICVHFHKPKPLIGMIRVKYNQAIDDISLTYGVNCRQSLQGPKYGQVVTCSDNVECILQL